MIGLQLFTGLVQGMLLVLLALGLSLIFGLMTVVNFAHGAFYMLGAYVGFFILGLTGSFWLGLVVVPLAIGTLGLLVERTLIKPLYGGDLNDPLLLTFGLTSVIIEIVKLIWGRWGFPLTPRRPWKAWSTWGSPSSRRTTSSSSRCRRPWWWRCGCSWRRLTWA